MRNINLGLMNSDQVLCQRKLDTNSNLKQGLPKNQLETHAGNSERLVRQVC